MAEVQVPEVGLHLAQLLREFRRWWRCRDWRKRKIRFQRLGHHAADRHSLRRRSDELAHSSIRFTIGRFTTEADIDYTIDLLKRKVGKLRELSPLWEMHQEGVDLSKIEWAAH